MHILVIVGIARFDRTVIGEQIAKRQARLKALIKGNDVIAIVCHDAVWCRDAVAFDVAIKWTDVRKSTVAQTCIDAQGLIDIEFV